MRRRASSKPLRQLLAVLAVVLVAWAVAQTLRQGGRKERQAVPTRWVRGRIIVGPDAHGVDPLLGRPLGLAIDEDAEELYVADYKRNVVTVFNYDGRLKRTIGRTGQGPGEFLQPVDVDLAAGKLHVLEAGNYRVSILDTNGEYLASFEVGPLSSDQKIAVSSDGRRIYLNEPTPMSRKLFAVYDEAGTVVQRFGNLLEPVEGAGKFETNTVCFDLDRDGNLYVFYTCTPVVRKYDAEGHLVYSGTLRIFERDDKLQDWKLLLKKHPMGALVTFVSDVFVTSSGRVYLAVPASRRLVRESGEALVILYEMDVHCQPLRRLLWQVQEPGTQTYLNALCVSGSGKVFGTMASVPALVVLDVVPAEVVN